MGLDSDARRRGLIEYLSLNGYATMRQLAGEFDVSINTLLGEPRKLFCQCCGMPIDDDSILGRDKDGTLNEEYCKWCYVDGTYTYNDMDDFQSWITGKDMMNLVTMGSLKSLKNN